MNSQGIPNVDQRSRAVFASLCLLELVFATWLSLTCPRVFTEYFGSVHPLLVIVTCVALASAILVFLQRHRRFYVLQPGKLFPRLATAFSAATIFAIVVVAVDVNFPFSADINVPSPQSWLFYPAIAFVVETIFHLLPLVILTGIGSKIFTRQTNSPDSSELLERKAIMIGMFIFVASLEPIFQVVFACFERPLSGLDLFVVFHVFAIGLVQLYLFRRYDFITMFSFRIVYYLFWHIIWGHLRIQVLF